MSQVSAVEHASAAIARSSANDRASSRVSLIRERPGWVLIAIAVADLIRSASADLWGHVRFGQMFLARGHLLAIDPFGYSAPGHLWLHHEWMAEAAMAAAYGLAGVIGLKLLKLLCSACAIGFLAMAMGETGAGLGAQFAVLLASALPLSVAMQFRPQMFDFAVFGAMLWILARNNYRSSSPLWPMLPLFVLWSNLHGAFVIGLAALGAYAAAVLVEDAIGGAGIGRGARLGAMLAACAIASLLNPIGIQEWKTIAVTLHTPITSKAMSDFAPLWTRLPPAGHGLIGGYTAYVLAMMLALAVLFAARPRAGDLPLMAVAGLMGFAAFSAIRNVGFAVLALAPPLARRISLLNPAGESAPAADRGAERRGRTLIEAGFAIAIAIGTGVVSPRLGVGFPLPSSAIAFMDSHRLRGNILNDFKWGQYLIWHTAERDRVFIDGRFDLAYPLGVLTDYLHFQNGDSEAARVLDSYAHDYVLISPRLKAYGFMMKQPRWRLIYEDGDAALFARADSAAAKIAGIPVKGTAPPREFP